MKILVKGIALDPVTRKYLLLSQRLLSKLIIAKPINHTMFFRRSKEKNALKTLGTLLLSVQNFYASVFKAEGVRRVEAARRAACSNK